MKLIELLEFTNDTQIHEVFHFYEMVGWHHQLNGHEFETTGNSEGQGSLACLGSMGSQRDMTERLNHNNLGHELFISIGVTWWVSMHQEYIKWKCAGYSTIGNLSYQVSPISKAFLSHR